MIDDDDDVVLLPTMCGEREIFSAANTVQP